MFGKDIASRKALGQAFKRALPAGNSVPYGLLGQIERGLHIMKG